MPDCTAVRSGPGGDKYPRTRWWRDTRYPTSYLWRILLSPVFTNESIAYDGYKTGYIFKIRFQKSLKIYIKKNMLFWGIYTNCIGRNEIQSGGWAQNWLQLNWLFANTPVGAQASAVIYSLIETAKENKLDPYKYLLWVLQSAPVLSEEDAAWTEKLLPANAPEECYMPHK